MTDVQQWKIQLKELDLDLNSPAAVYVPTADNVMRSADLTARLIEEKEPSQKTETIQSFYHQWKNSTNGVFMAADKDSSLLEFN